MLISIPIYDEVDLLDVAGPFEMFNWAGFTMQLVAASPGPVVSRGGLVIQAQVDYASADRCDVLWVPGGDPSALKVLMGEGGKRYRDFLIRQSAGARYVCSVCEGALLLASAGLLDGYEATTHWYYVPCLKELFPKVKVVDGHPRYCLDRNRLTGGGISSGLDEALELIQLLAGTGKAQEVQQTTQYYPRPPVQSEIPRATKCDL